MNVLYSIGEGGQGSHRKIVISVPGNSLASWPTRELVTSHLAKQNFKLHVLHELLT